MISFGTRMNNIAAWRWGCWFRICGYGLWLALDDGTRLFSERHGFRIVHYAGPFRFQVLQKAKPQ